MVVFFPFFVIAGSLHITYSISSLCQEKHEKIRLLFGPSVGKHHLLCFSVNFRVSFANLL